MIVDNSTAIFSGENAGYGSRLSYSQGILQPVQSGMGVTVHDAETYRMKALACAKLVDEVESGAKRDHLLNLQRSYQLLARNAEWLANTDEFLRDQYRRWNTQTTKMAN